MPHNIEAKLDPKEINPNKKQMNDEFLIYKYNYY